MKAYGVCLSKVAASCGLGFRMGHEYFCSKPTQCHSKRETPTLEIPTEHKPGMLVARNQEPALARPQKFWMVQRIDELGKLATQKHGTKEAAQREAIRLAETYGGEYAVMEAIQLVRATAVTTAPSEPPAEVEAKAKVSATEKP